jgi:glycosyltransferase involved in cell wall biosynthesis
LTRLPCGDFPDGIGRRRLDGQGATSGSSTAGVVAMTTSCGPTWKGAWWDHAGGDQLGLRVEVGIQTRPMTDTAPERRRPAVTVCVITLNEEHRIAECLRSADFADEFVVVDSHSTDRTRDIARELGARVLERDWPGYTEQKAFAIAQASHEWVLLLDADERVSSELRASILAALEKPDLPDGYEFARRSHYFGRPIFHGGWYPDRKLHLFRKSRAHIRPTSVHERVRVHGRVERLSGDLLHYSYDSIDSHVRVMNSYTTSTALEKLTRGQRARLGDLTLRPFGKFLRMYVLKAGFRDGIRGFIIAVMGAFYVFLKYAKLRELQQHDMTGPD